MDESVLVRRFEPRPVRQLSLSPVVPRMIVNELSPFGHYPSLLLPLRFEYEPEPLVQQLFIVYNWEVEVTDN